MRVPVDVRPMNLRAKVGTRHDIDRSRSHIDGRRLDVIDRGRIIRRGTVGITGDCCCRIDRLGFVCRASGKQQGQQGNG